MAEQTITCKQCSNTFILTEGEQQSFINKGLTPPKRCPACRAQNRANAGGQQQQPQQATFAQPPPPPVYQPEREAGGDRGGPRRPRNKNAGGSKGRRNKRDYEHDDRF